MPENDRVIHGRAFVLGDNVDTDQIIPAQYLNLVPTIPEEYRQLGAHAFAGLPRECAPFVPAGEARSPYSVVVAGRNFGCGSSREHAPIALGAAGIRAVAAQSYARIFFRNAVATGELYPLETEAEPAAFFHTGDDVRIDLDAGTLTGVRSGRSFKLKPLGAVAPVIQAGGIFGYARQTGMIRRTPETSLP